MKHLNFICLTFALGFPLISKAATEFPVCFQMENDALSRVYAVVKDFDDPFSAIATKDSVAVKVYEYYKEKNYPKSITLQSSYNGTARLDFSNNIEQVSAGTVTGLDVGSSEVVTTQIGKEPMSGTWIARRSTYANNITMHNLLEINCSDVSK